MQPLKLRTQLLIFISLSTFLVTLLFSWVYTNQYRKSSMTMLQDIAVTISEDVAIASSSYLVMEMYVSVQDLILHYQKHTSLKNLIIYNDKKTAIAYLDKNTSLNQLEELKLNQFQFRNDEQEMIYLHEIAIQNQVLGYVEAVFSLSTIQKQLVTTYQKGIIGGILAWLLFMAFGVYVVNRLTRRLTDIVESSSAIVEGQYSLTTTGHGSHEFNKLSRALHTLSERIHERDLEQQQHQQQIESIKNYLHDVVDSMPSMMIGLNNKQQITLWNSHAEEVTGLLIKDAIGRDLFQAVPFLEQKKSLVLETLKDKSQTIIPRVPDSSRVRQQLYDVTIFPLGADCEKEVIIRLDDVTEQAQLEKTMVQAEKMLSVGGLAAGMAHEINNPLAGILQSIQVVTRRFLPEIASNKKIADELNLNLEIVGQYIEKRQINQMLHNACESAARAAEIVSSMLSFARKEEKSKSTCNLNSLLDNTIAIASSDYDLKKKFDFKKIEIIKDYASDLPLINCERTKIQQVILNLLKNGAYAMTESGIKKPRIMLKTEYSEEYIRISITDNGPGIPEDIQQRVFEPFFTTKPVGIGTGLGLSVSYFIITEDHQGSLKVDSIPGSTTFIIELPNA